MKKYYEIKDIAVADAPVKDVDMATRTVVGYYARYGNIDHDGDMIVPGALAKTIKERGPEGKNIIPHLADHWMDTDHLLARPTKLYEVADGAIFESKIIDTNKGTDILKQYRDGLIFNHSFGFKTLNGADKEGYRELRELMQFEFSTVVLGANDQTDFLGFRGLTKPQIIERYKHLEKCYRSGDYTDGYFTILEAQLKEYKERMVELFIKEQNGAETQTTGPVTAVTTRPEVKAFVLEMELTRFVNALKN
jgi:HK97 family phage prohead protease